MRLFVVALIWTAICVLSSSAFGAEPNSAKRSKPQLQLKESYWKEPAFKKALEQAESKQAPEPDPKRWATCMAETGGEELFCKVYWSSFVAEPVSPLKEQEPLSRSLEESQRIWQSDVAPLLKEGQDWADLERANARKRFAACSAAFGDARFCKCLNEHIHFLADFQTYVRIVISDASPIPAPKSEEERLINSVFRSREQCAARGD